MSVVFDIEADGLKPTKIHCLVWTSDGVTHEETSYEGMREFFKSNDVFIGHNIQRFDIPAVEKLLGIKIKGQFIDTLALSWYLEPERVRHGLESYGEEFGVPKPKIDDWENLTVEEYVHRCTEDVKINWRLWNKQDDILRRLYEHKQDLHRFLKYMEFKMDCAREQEEIGWPLDVDGCLQSVAELTKERDEKLEELVQVMPKVPNVAIKKRPAKPYKMNGSLSKSGGDWKELCDSLGIDPWSGPDSVEVIKGYDEPNPNSHEQIKAWLYELGWKPETFKFLRDKVTGDLRKIPQVSQDKAKGGGLCPSVLKLAGKEPGINVFDGLSVLNHRLSVLNGFLKAQENGMLKAEIAGLTNTLRFKHATIVNLPGVTTRYGEHIRRQLLAPPNKELCGSDCSGLEDRLKQHFIYPYDPDYVNEMNTEDYDPHLSLALEAGAVSEQQVDAYKTDDHKDKDVKNTRHIYKQGNYACQYGAGPPRLALTIGRDKATAERIHKAYWNKNWAVKQAAEDCHTKVCDGRMWLYNPISKFWYSLRNEKDRFSTLVQGSAVFCFDTWVMLIRKNGGPKICGQFHDEVVIPVSKGIREKVTAHLKSAIAGVNKKLNLNRELDVDVQFGDNYAEIH